MTKYRIVKFNTGKYGVQEKWEWYMFWYMNGSNWDTVEAAQEYIDFSINYDKERNECKKRKIVEIIS